MPVNGTVIEDLLSGNIAKAVIDALAQAFGPWMWAILLGFTLIMVWQKTRSPLAVLIVAAAWVIALGSLLPAAAKWMLWSVAAGCVAAILYRVFSR